MKLSERKDNFYEKSYELQSLRNRRIQKLTGVLRKVNNDN